MKATDICISPEEAIHYMEEILRESSRVMECFNTSAPIFQDWLTKLYNMLTIIYGADSSRYAQIYSIDFGPIGPAYENKQFINGMQKILKVLRAWVVELKHSITLNEFSRDCFVAMWFDNSMDDVYRRGYFTPLRELGYNPIRIDKIEHNERIDQLIFDRIRRSRFLIADFSGHRSGVYYEAGFASGLGIPVIHTCNEKAFAERHFDILTINTILYKTADELSCRLKDRIRATVDGY